MEKWPSIAELRKLSDEEIIDKHDEIANSDSFPTGTKLDLVKFYIEELFRRSSERQTKSIVGLTKMIAAMTFMMTAATIINVIIFTR